MLDAGGGAWAFAVEVADLSGEVERLRRAGLPIAEPRTGKIVRPDGSTATWGMAGLTEGPAWMPFLIQYAVPLEERLSRAPQPTWSLDHLVLETADPAGGADLLSALLGLPVLEGHLVPLPGGHIRLVPGTAERVTTVAFAGAEDPRGAIAGLRFLRG